MTADFANWDALSAKGVSTANSLVSWATESGWVNTRAIAVNLTTAAFLAFVVFRASLFTFWALRINTGGDFSVPNEGFNTAISFRWFAFVTEEAIKAVRAEFSGIAREALLSLIAPLGFFNSIAAHILLSALAKS